jgi:DNA uptake protein ComE-like DNA-binding protein
MAKTEHHHPGQGELRSYGPTHHEEQSIDLDNAGLDELAALPMAGRKRAEHLMRHRPFKTWEDVENVPSFDRGMVDDLKSSGARL